MTLEIKLQNAIRRGDQAEIYSVFCSIYHKYCRLVGYIVSKYVHNVSDVEELVDDVFVNFSREIFATQIKNIKSYLATSAKNSAVDFVRKTQRLPHFVYDEFYLQNQAYVPTDGTDYNDLVVQLAKCLSVEETNVLLLNALHGYSFAEISQKLNKPKSTVFAIYCRAISKAKKGVKL